MYDVCGVHVWCVCGVWVCMCDVCGVCGVCDVCVVCVVCMCGVCGVHVWCVLRPQDLKNIVSMQIGKSYSWWGVVILQETACND